ncbi:metalloregulator ArsR/SmtB family transcription factor [Halogeometricum sp. S1BR25-6]|uniref:Metalloregulator ArsR/SmtB family transcription factor n=1 Tax=Halogeometricum salsisoli TaxID=2950536 RepID=A0ABU2G9H3_9EURY|nr:metalloregulator ArsR/SmtB family transcription factor [Halogeometricum sp. S1BR25-6]MDS0297419.1 metalloregulator ArsR/SmtB family transcription factor [Halogeometricum sp. S1BR25-6]
MVQGAKLEGDAAEENGDCCGTAELGPDGASDRTVERDVETLKALGSDTRYRVVRLLAAADEELCVCEITPRFEVSDSAVSHALSDLAEAGLVARRKQGTWRYYRPTDRAAKLVDALDATRGEER